MLHDVLKDVDASKSAQLARPAMLPSSLMNSKD